MRAAEQAARSDAQAEAPAGTSVALVVADSGREVNAALRAEYPRTRSGGSRTLAGSGGYAGRAAGLRANIGGTGVGGGSSAAIAR